MQASDAMRLIGRLGPRALTDLPALLRNMSVVSCAVSLPRMQTYTQPAPLSSLPSAIRHWSTTSPLSDPDDIYRQATQEMWDQTRQQKRLASKIQSALNLELLQRDILREFFVGECGFQIMDVRLSRDNMKAFILWSAYPAQMHNAQIGLTRQLKHLRAAVAQRIQTRAVPRLEFRQNRLTADQAALENLLDDLKADRDEEEQEHLQSEDHAQPRFESDEDTEGHLRPTALR